MSLHISLPSPRLLIPRVQLSPRRQSPTVKKISSVNRRTQNFKMNQQKFYKRPSINPETNRKIKIDGKTYKKLVTIYGQP